MGRTTRILSCECLVNLFILPLQQQLVHLTASLTKIYVAKDMVCLTHMLNLARLKVIFYAILLKLHLKLTHRRVTPLVKPLTVSILYLREVPLTSQFMFRSIFYMNNMCKLYAFIN